MKITLTIAELVIISLAIQSLIAALLLVCRSGSLAGSGWLAAIILSISVCAIVRVISAGMHLEDAHPWLVPLIFQPGMLVGPFIYFYARSLIYGSFKLKIGHGLHLVPALKGAGPQIAFVLFHTGLLYSPFVQSIYFTRTAQSIIFNVDTLDNLPLLLSLLAYSVVSYRLLRKHEAGVSASRYKLTDTKWLKNLLYLFLGLAFLFFATIILNLQPLANKGVFINVIFFIPLTGFTYWLSVSSLIRRAKMTADDIAMYNKVPSKIYFSDEDAIRHSAQLLVLMDEDKLYLDPHLKMDNLAARLDITERAISNLLNQHLGKNFNDFVNQYRVEAAKGKLADSNYDQYTIAAIAYECGFNSLATFQRCFKQFTGITPSRYMQQIKASPGLVSK